MPLINSILAIFSLPAVNTITLSSASEAGTVVMREDAGTITLPGVTVTRDGPTTSFTYTITFGTEPAHGSGTGSGY